mgnify:CR=1 FL=1
MRLRQIQYFLSVVDNKKRASEKSQRPVNSFLEPSTGFKPATPSLQILCIRFAAFDSYLPNRMNTGIVFVLRKDLLV